MCEFCLMISHRALKVGLVVTHDGAGGCGGGLRYTDAERNQLKLRYYVLLTSKKDVFPNPTLEKKLGVFKAANSITFPAST